MPQRVLLIIFLKSNQQWKNSMSRENFLANCAPIVFKNNLRAIDSHWRSRAGKKFFYGTTVDWFKLGELGKKVKCSSKTIRFPEQNWKRNRFLFTNSEFFLSNLWYLSANLLRTFIYLIFFTFLLDVIFSW